MHSRSHVAACSAILIVVSAAPALGSPGKGGLNAFRDSNAVPAESTQQAGLAVSAAQCAGLGRRTASGAQTPPGFPPGITIPKIPGIRKKKTRIPSFKSALATAQKTATGKGTNRKVLGRLKKGPALRTEGAARGFAVAADIAGSPRLALAGLLVANRLDPKDRMNLVNAAAPLALLGQPDDAIALLDHAAKMHGPLPEVMGVPGKAVLHNNRGYAYAKLKDHSAAIAALRKALSAAPAMAEANTNLGSELACAGQTAAALRYIRAGLQRTKVDLVSPAPSNVGAVADQLPKVPIANQVADLSAGIDGTLPPFVTPTSAAGWAAYQPTVAAMNDATSAALGAATDQRNAALEQAKKLKGSLATFYRSTSITDLVNTSNAEPDILALNNAALDALKAADTVAADHWVTAVPAKSMECSRSGTDYEACFRPWCEQATAAATGSFNGAFAGAERAVREYWRVAGKRETGLAANLTDQEWHDVAMGDIRTHAAAEMGALISTMQGWVGPLKFFEKLCTPQPEPPPAPGEMSPKVDSPGACPPALAAFTGSFKNEVQIPPGAGSEKASKVDVTVKVSCSKAEVELSAKVKGTADLISVFGKGEQDFKKDTTTVVVGAKGSVLGLATGQSGFYVTAGRNGIEDFGWRVGAGGSADPFGGLSSTTVGVKVWGGTENISFVGAVDYIPTAFGFGGP